jgi:large subunit ribosomal protein L16
MLFPKKVKHRKWHTMRDSSKKAGKVATRGTEVSFGSFGLKAVSPARVRSQQIEAARKAMVREAGKLARVWIRIFPDMPFTNKAAEVPMGNGKGDLQGYQFLVTPGRMIFELDGISEAVAREALRKAGTKLPVKTKIVAR